MGMAPKAVAAAIFELAQTGYIAIRLPTAKTSPVRLRRTDKSPNDLLPEQQALLNVVFKKEGNESGARAYLSNPGEFPIAQTIAAGARALLVADGSVKKLQPRSVYRSLNILFYSIILLGITVVTIGFWQFQAFALSLIISIVLWAFYAEVALGLKHRRVFRTAKSSARYQMLNELRTSSRYNTFSTSVAVDADQLPYELLWLRHGTPRSIASGFYDQQPSWCEGSWPATREDVTLAMVTAMEMLSRSLSQEPVKGIYTVNPEAQITALDVADARLGVFTDVDDTMSEAVELSHNLGDWGGETGGDGSGGDSGDGGDGGDGSGGDGGDGGGDG
jgi:uncharacterized membrane protein YgcG